jgi:hypothetical protein
MSPSLRPIEMKKKRIRFFKDFRTSFEHRWNSIAGGATSWVFRTKFCK